MDTAALFTTVRAWVLAHYPSHQALEITVRITDGCCERKARLPIPLRLIEPSPARPAAQLPAEPMPAASPEPTHSEDFRSCSIGGERYDFGATQAAVVKLLWEAHESGHPDLGQESILEAVGSDSNRLRDLFRAGAAGAHPAWGNAIIPGRRKGTFRLDLDEPSN